MVNVFIGTSGFLYSHWVGNFYPKDLKREEFLSFYAKHFSTVEINSSFYHIPRQQTVLNWRKQTPADFIFTFKMSRFVTHFAKLDPKAKSFPLFFEAIKSLGFSLPKHLILIQTHSSFKVNAEKLKNFLKQMPARFLYAFEFRHESWFNKEIYKILKRYNSAVVLSDSPNKMWPYEDIDTANFFYIRFHGSRRLFASSYTDEELKFYAKLIKEKLKKGFDVYCYFNNDAEGAAVENAKRLKHFLK